jgi:signal transduction histidine kinase
MAQVRAFEVGGVDYVTKPFRVEELRGRVRTHVQMRRQQRELEQSYERLRELERLRDNLFHMIVHDLRSPLGVISVSLDLMRDIACAPEPEFSRVLGAARGCARKLSEMIAQLLDISRLEAGQMPLDKQWCDMVQTAKAAIDSAGAAVCGWRPVLIAPDRSEALFDPDVVRRVIENLLGNAFKFSPRNAEVKLAIVHEGADVLVTVTDNGPGIPLEHREKIFEKFAQVESRQKRHGVGLGLTFCKLAIEAHGGRIGVESEPGKGSTFWFTLPDGQRAG